jgi:hypothetical protein
MMAVTARAAKTNFAIWALLRQLLPCSLTDENMQGMEAPRSEVLHATPPYPAAGFPLPISAAPAITTCGGEQA